MALLPALPATAAMVVSAVGVECCSEMAASVVPVVAAVSAEPALSVAGVVPAEPLATARSAVARSTPGRVVSAVMAVMAVPAVMAATAEMAAPVARAG